ncbi:NlpC/P60 family protein [Bradyrhizobium lablabi]|uniref:NlpC/P60 family protein n=1 Tax=Bradyrhizobium lablabi TaxID=722472 RepID=UPI001BAA6F7C|nr:NlpC/P60 family protein [Bradyrhizobium lablabi]MBR0693126.1 C40 family peptidase [Bradyrhizobium lablabi]
MDLSAAISHADRFWPVPCKDGLVVTREKMINVQQEMKARKLDPAIHEAVFLFYSADAKTREGLFIIHKSFSNLENRITSNFSVDSVPDPRIFLISFPDGNRDTAIGQTAPFTGLNDCAHFVSECLMQAKIKGFRPTNDAEQLFKNLRGLGQLTKTLAKHVEKEKARRIINSGLLKPGDVILFATPKLSHLHSTLYLGNQQIAMHTHLNHKRAKGDQLKDSQIQRDNNWETSSNDSHPFVSIIHFARPDDVFVGSAFPGWWEVTKQGRTQFYFFDKKGSVGATARQPNFSRPIVGAEASGYWFDDGLNLKICWGVNGDFESFRLMLPVQSPVRGRLNGQNAVEMTKRA